MRLYLLSVFVVVVVMLSTVVLAQQAPPVLPSATTPGVQPVAPPPGAQPAPPAAPPQPAPPPGAQPGTPPPPVGVSPGSPPPGSLQPMAPPVTPGAVAPGVLANLSRALSSAKEVKRYLSAGKIWTFVGPGGVQQIKGAILYRGRVIAVVNFSPSDGRVLPMGFIIPSSQVTPEALKEAQFLLPQVVKNIVVLDGAEYLAPENSWAIPLSYNGMIVGKMKIYYDGVHVVPDYVAEGEMSAAR